MHSRPRIDDTPHHMAKASGVGQKPSNPAKPISLPTCQVALKPGGLSVDGLDAAEALLDAQDAARFTSAA